MPFGIPESRRAPSALVFDETTRDFRRDPVTGRYLSQHWVDAAAFFLLRTKQGSVRSAPLVGETISHLEFVLGPELQTVVEDRVALAWQRLLDRRLILILGVDLDRSVEDAVVYQANYRNLVTGGPNKVPFRPIG